MSKVIIGMATIKERLESMLDTVESLTEQADEIHVYANDYDGTQDTSRIDDLYNVHMHYAPLGDLGDSAFMYPFIKNEYEDAVFYIVGDDVLYPPNYVETMFYSLRSVSNTAISLHGRRQFSPLDSYYNSLKPEDAFNGFRSLKAAKGVTILGTAYACWHSNLVKWSWDDFPQNWRGLNSRNMGDIWFSKKLNEMGVARLVIPHAADWVKHSKKIDLSKTIARRARSDDFVQTKLFNSVEWTITAPSKQYM